MRGLVNGAVLLARNLGLSKLLVGAVVVGFGTAMPELTVSISAALKGSTDVVIGNIVGSNIANILLIGGISAIIGPLVISGLAIKRDTVVMLLASLVLCALALGGIIGLLPGSLMFLSLIVYIGWSYHQDKQRPTDSSALSEHSVKIATGKSTVGALVYAILGLGVLVIGAYMLVTGAVAIARGWGISEAVIGLTVVAVGTSLPELATSIVAAYRQHGEVIIGNILGSNIFNILGILGLTATIFPIPIAEQIARYDVWLLLGVTSLFAVYLFCSFRISRISGVVMLLSYVTYTAWLYSASLGG